MTTTSDIPQASDDARARPDAGDAADSSVIARILAHLQAHRLHAGDRLPSERDLAEQLGVGRNAVREALATLATLRIVELRPNSGIYLRQIERESSFEALVMLTDMGGTPTRTEVAETMEVRAHLEIQALGLACKRRTEQDLSRLEAVLRKTEEVLAQGGNIAACDTDFHIAVADATHNSVLVRVLNAFYRFTSRRRTVLFEDAAQGKASLRDHRRLLEHIRNRDSAKAQLLILRHMDRARNYWSAVLGG
ncbi:FadR/GntR family transcriptional regulator [Variovorax sp. 770b2]|uniref:FadR/GntR family transcriptional regulator n=1 Tax=Variovorax sp. 770b2 TaxID=1566271 RepID=UPI0008EDBB09|nr:FadR/GntR family transcriptional regulator [Variovorax sp. 770b2]SFP25493.1 DNA-binding transcriptional regulator, FadR family [Variovorax sp. 770b2]